MNQKSMVISGGLGLKKRSNYKSFRKYLEHDFSEQDIENKQNLGVLMMNAGYRQFIDKKTNEIVNGYPTQKMLDYAYNFLQSRSVQVEIIRDWIYESYSGNTVYRANKNIVINGKSYRKGQFIPKRK